MRKTLPVPEAFLYYEYFYLSVAGATGTFGSNGI